MMRSVLELAPTTNYAMASLSERADSMESLARVLMGLSHPVQLVSQAREVVEPSDWPKPPRMERRWLAVVEAEDATALDWRTRTLKDAMEGVGLRCEVLCEVLWDLSQAVVAAAANVEAGCVSEIPVAAQPHDSGMGCGWASTLVLRRWPREVAPGWLGHALAGDLPVDVGIHIQPQDAERTARFLTRQQSWQSDQHTVKPDAANELGRTDAERVRKKLIARTDRPVKVAIALTVRAPDRDALRGRVETLKHEIGLTLGDVRLATFEQDRGLRATLPTGRCDLLGAWRTLDCASVASTWPFQPATVNHEHGAPLGTTHHGSMLVKLDPFDPSLESFGGVILAKVGMGKSYVLKLIARRLEGVEVLIVEQRNPGEYAAVQDAQVLNLADVPYDRRADHLRSFVSGLWETAKADPRPRLLVLDELWSLLRDPALAALIEEIARIGRHHYLSLWIATQQVTELLEDRGGKAVLDNAAVRIYLKQHDRDLEKLCDAVGLSAPARRFLRGAARGQALLDVSGLLVAVDIQASPEEHQQITTDPREVRHGVGNLAEHPAGATGVPVGPASGAAAVGVQHRVAAPAAAE